MRTTFDAVIVGGGMVGAACAWRLSACGARVVVVDAGVPGGGATGAGMGHVMVTDDSPAQFALTRYSRRLWDELAPELPKEAERVGCGTLWVAEDEEEMQAAWEKAAFYTSNGERAEVVDAKGLAGLEPNLRAGLLGGLRLPQDSIVYPPVVVRWMLERVKERGGEVRVGVAVAGIGEEKARLANGEVLEAPVIVNATGVWAPELTAGVPVKRRKGHLLITDRYPGFCTHEIVELGYLKAAHGHASEAVAFNLQMRGTGQLLLGSTRQYGVDTSEVEPRIVRKLIDRGVHFMPGLAEMKVLRVWTGFRAATPDSLPLIGRLEADRSIILATGHEGLGITTAMGTAWLVGKIVCGGECAIAGEAYEPSAGRLGGALSHA